MSGETTRSLRNRSRAESIQGYRNTGRLQDRARDSRKRPRSAHRENRTWSAIPETALSGCPSSLNAPHTCFRYYQPVQARRACFTIPQSRERRTQRKAPVLCFPLLESVLICNLLTHLPSPPSPCSPCLCGVDRSLFPESRIRGPESPCAGSAMLAEIRPPQVLRTPVV